MQRSGLEQQIVHVALVHVYVTAAKLLINQRQSYKNKDSDIDISDGSESLSLHPHN